MSDERLDELAESARNRGLKLVRSRVRTPGKRRFGKVGLTDPKGKPVLGIDDKGPTAKPEEVEQYLRNLGAKDWGASLGVAVMPRKKKKPRPERAREPANDEEPEPGPKRKPEPEPEPEPPRSPKPKIREAKPGDAKALVELFEYLGHPIDEKAVRKNLAALKKTRETPLVATLDKKTVGVCGLGRRVVIHRPAPIGRITALVENGKLFDDLGVAPLDPETDRVMICGSMQMLQDVKKMAEERGFVEGSLSNPATFVVERAFVG